MPKNDIAYILTQPDTAVAQIVRQLTKAKGQVLVLAPEISTAKHLATVIKNPDPDRIIFGTRKDLFRTWDNLTDIIVEDPLHEAYKSDMTPKYNAPDVARQLAQLHDASLTYLSPALSTANYYLAEKKIFTLAKKKPYWPSIAMADMSAQEQKGNRSILSERSQETIMNALDDGERVLVFSPRRAYATTVRCQHCRKAVMCATCDIPMRLHRTTEDMLICYRCSAYMRVPKQCSICHSGPLKPGGLAGSQKIVTAINESLDRHGLKKQEIPILDSDLVKSEKDEREIMAQSPKILVATQMIFSHRYTEAFDHIIVVQADALSYNPDFRTQERLIYQLEKLADFHPATMTIQYWDSNAVIDRATDRDWESFYADELKDRKTFNWPPFSRIAKITCKTHQAARIAAERLSRAIEHLGATKGAHILGPTPDHALILKTTLPDEDLRELLVHLPPGAMVDVDPRSIA